MCNLLNTINKLHKFQKKQQGAALMVMLVILVIGATAIMISSLNSRTLQVTRDQTTTEALAQAKEALIGYAVSVNLTSAPPDRPGDLPCPDTNNDGVTDSPCGDASGSNQTMRLGRLPWKTLRLPDLRDGSGERLWYAVSNNFKKSTRTTCASAGDPGCLNSDSIGTITVRASDGSILYDGSGTSGVVAIIIAPGDILQRTDKVSAQDRSLAGINTAENYLDVALGEDNANFVDGSTDGFIQGVIKNTNGKVLLNDQIQVITQDNIMQPIQRRVAGEVKNCLDNYASVNRGRYPWAVKITDLGSTYNDRKNEYFGRIPDDLSKSDNDINTAFSNQWNTCNTHMILTPAPWWINWKENVFYGLANKFKPSNSSAPIFPTICTTPGNCININNSSTPARYVVIVAGKKLSIPDQTLRNSNKTNAFYYLEGGNENADQTGGFTFTQTPASATFNDTVEFK